MYDPTGLTILVLCGVAIVGVQLVASRTRANSPVLLVVAGVVLAFVPTTAEVRVAPELVILLFLPALLYWESLTTSLREIRNDLRSLVLSSVFLVIATSVAVAGVAHGVLGLSWAVGFVLGAIVAPTDATAVSAMARGLPRRQVTMLRAESLVNDGTALVLFGVAVSVAIGQEDFRPVDALGEFSLSYLGGVLVGVLVAWLALLARRAVHDSLVQNAVSVLTPFVAFLLASEVGASGVLAVVVGGLVLSRAGPRAIDARTRVQAHAFWQIVTFLLNAALFLLVGLQLPAAIGALPPGSLGPAVAAAGLIAVVVVATRLLWMNVVPYLVRLIDRRTSQRARRIGFRQRLPLAWSGVRGGVSLAIALAVPLTTVDGTPFPDRDLLLVMTFGVILVTLVGQGLSLPAVVRLARFPPDSVVEQEMSLARSRTTDAALAILPQVAEDHEAPDALIRRLRVEHECRRDREGQDEGRAEDREIAVERAVRLALVHERRRVLLELRDDSAIDDQVLLYLQAELDHEELGITGAPRPE